MRGSTTARPSIAQVSKARPCGWSLSRSVPKTYSGCPDRMTLTDGRWVRETVRSAEQHRLVHASRCHVARGSGRQHDALGAEHPAGSRGGSGCRRTGVRRVDGRHAPGRARSPEPHVVRAAVGGDPGAAASPAAGDDEHAGRVGEEAAVLRVDHLQGGVATVAVALDAPDGRELAGGDELAGAGCPVRDRRQCRGAGCAGCAGRGGRPGRGIGRRGAAGRGCGRRPLGGAAAQQGADPGQQYPPARQAHAVRLGRAAESSLWSLDLVGRGGDRGAAGGEGRAGDDDGAGRG